MNKKDFYWHDASKTWYILVAADHEYAFTGSEWWKGKAQVMAKGFDYSNRYGWFVKMGVTVGDYQKQYPKRESEINKILEELP